MSVHADVLFLVREGAHTKWIVHVIQCVNVPLGPWSLGLLSFFLLFQGRTA
jgi:hypothetical protein